MQSLAVVPTAAAEPPFEVVPVAAPEAQEEAVGFLRELLADSLARHEALSRTAASATIDVIENAVRCGWHACDAKSYLIAPGQFGRWVKENFSVSQPWLDHLRKLSSLFARDLIDSQERAKLGIHPKGLGLSVGVHLRTQIAELEPKSLCQLLRLAGILRPSLPAPGGFNNGAGAAANGHGPDGKEPPGDLGTLTRSLQRRLNKLPPPYGLSDEQRKELIRTLKPIAVYYQELVR